MDILIVSDVLKWTISMYLYYSREPGSKPTYNNTQTLCFTCFNRCVFRQQKEKGKTQNWKAANIPTFNLYLPLFSANTLYSSALARIWCLITSMAYLHRMYGKSLYWHCTHIPGKLYYLKPNASRKWRSGPTQIIQISVHHFQSTFPHFL